MPIRQQQASNFYSGASQAWIEKALRGFEVSKLEKAPVAGLVPHAGWEFSGAVAAKVYQSIKAYRTPDTVICFGTVHQNIPDNAIYCRGAWETPFGKMSVDEALADRLLQRLSGLAERNESAHEHEHSIEVQMPFLKYFFPEARAVPISILPDERAHLVGRRVGELVKEESYNALIIGTTDLTHYGDAYFFTRAGYGHEAHEWMKRNDARIIGLASALRDDEIVAEAESNRNACGAGAMAATAGAAKVFGCRAGQVVAYTTSYDMAPEREFRLGVGYVGMLFCA
ncbi:MAG: AmmeMemoRadiSam system protein B [Candidatus Abyssobacteria bacterium SURF_5]|uniref:AmmeMemoRadiSam system protein B n=1 Tax=Abyssobacteria bacterium (strain SURF_5) TaxID=2093360 RepID=A0A3A4N256_ABYX5|nr:MAG: AmmeMemoRadiSam system protein B [Candidatus Abyssubacteria bacterium SURF_5]